MDLLTKQKALLESIKNAIPHVNPFLYWTDVYKTSHKDFEVEGVDFIYSNATARFAHYMKNLLGDHFKEEYVVFGIQWMLLRLHTMAEYGFFKRDKDEVLAEMEATLQKVVGGDIDVSHFGELHDLGYLPIIVKALPEGTVAPIGTPFYTIENTDDRFEWLGNYLESGMSSDTWKQLTVATVARAFREISNKYSMETAGTTDGTEYQNHDFHIRGASGFESGSICGVAFLLSSCGTDNLPSLWACKNFYQADVNSVDYVVASSVRAGEHSVTTLGIRTFVEKYKEQGMSEKEAELQYNKWILKERFKTGTVSAVGDSYDYWRFVSEIVPEMKEDIMNRDGKFVVRGDSGDPVKVITGYIIYNADEDIKITGKFQTIEQVMLNTHLWWNNSAGYEVVKFKGKYYDMTDVTKNIGDCEISEAEAIGTVESLWNTFGGVVNNLGYKVLDSHIGTIYGDGITVQRADQILARLKAKGFEATVNNVVFGIGSYSLNMLSRDHLGIAIKATNAIVEINGEKVDMPIYKEPKTDSLKKSARGYIVVDTDENGKIITKDMQTRKAYLEFGLLRTVYHNGQFHVLTDLKEIRERLWTTEELVDTSIVD